MKRILILTLSGLLLLGQSLAMTASAAGTVAVSLSASPSTARPGDSVTISVNLQGVAGAGGVAAGDVKITYDTAKLTYQSASTGSGKPAADLDASVSGSTITLVYLDNLGGSNGFSSDGAMATLKFKVNDVSPGTAAFSMAADGFGDKNAGSINTSASGMNLTIAAPLSSDANLASLTVSNVTISPGFSAGTTNYTASVPFSVSKLEIQATAADGGAKVAVSSPVLAAGGTTNATVTVTAANGSKKTYTIKVTREQDPNYQASGNNNLSSITIDGFLLSPGFSADATQYVVWLPYETESVKVNAKAADGKANVEIAGGETLLAGQDNTVTVSCIAENGDRKAYTVIVKRAAAHDGSIDPVQTNRPENDATAAAETTEAAGDAKTDAPSGDGYAIWVVVLALVGGLILGGAGGFVLKWKVVK